VVAAISGLHVRQWVGGERLSAFQGAERVRLATEGKSGRSSCPVNSHAAHRIEVGRSHRGLVGEFEDGDGFVEVLQLEISERPESELGRCQTSNDGAAAEQLPAVRVGSHPCRGVDRGPEIVTRPLHDRPRVYADAERRPTWLAVDRAHEPKSRANRCQRRRCPDHHGVSDVLHDPRAIAERSCGECVVSDEHRRGVVVAVRLCERCEASNVGEDDGRVAHVVSTGWRPLPSSRPPRARGCDSGTSNVRARRSVRWP